MRFITSQGSSISETLSVSCWDTLYLLCSVRVSRLQYLFEERIDALSSSSSFFFFSSSFFFSFSFSFSFSSSQLSSFHSRASSPECTLITSLMTCRVEDQHVTHPVLHHLHHHPWRGPCLYASPQSVLSSQNAQHRDSPLPAGYPVGVHLVRSLLRLYHWD